MRALTLPQPWASLAANGHQLCLSLRWAWHMAEPGTRFAIHSNKRLLGSSLAEMDGCHFKRALEQLDEKTNPRQELLPLGCMLGTVELLGCHALPADKWGSDLFLRDLLRRYHPGLGAFIPLAQELMFSDYGPDRWVWCLGNPEPLPAPIPAKGHKRLWTVPTRLETALWQN